MTLNIETFIELYSTFTVSFSPRASRSISLKVVVLLLLLVLVVVVVVVVVVSVVTFCKNLQIQ